MIIGFLGRKRTGKDTAANLLIKKYGFIKYGFGDPVKDVARAMFCFDDEQLYGSKKEDVDPEWNVTPRKVLQVIGTEFSQYSIYKSLPELEEKVPMRNFWVNRFKKWYKEEIKINIGMNVVINDIRFQHEINAIKELNGHVIKITSDRQQYKDSHLSENEIDEINQQTIDFEITNNESIDSFHLKIEDIYENKLNKD